MALPGNQLAQDWGKPAWKSAAEVVPAAAVDDGGVVAVVVAAAAAVVPAVSSSIGLHQSIDGQRKSAELESPLYKFPNRVVVAEA
jgi:hypothetical protein